MQKKQSFRPCQELEPLERVLVIGCCGAGKSIFSAELARRLDVPHVERDALGELGSDNYRNAVATIVSTQRWVFDGPPYFVEDLVYPVAQRVLWLDYSRMLVIRRAIRRAFRRTFAPLEPGKTKRWRLQQWIAPGGPRFANEVYAARKREFSHLQHRAELVGKVLQFDTPTAAKAWLASLEACSP